MIVSPLSPSSKLRRREYSLYPPQLMRFRSQDYRPSLLLEWLSLFWPLETSLFCFSLFFGGYIEPGPKRTPTAPSLAPPPSKNLLTRR